jgi:two-component system cell cycle response regulator DivK
MPIDTRIRVLLVEDDTRLQLLGRKVLERSGYAVAIAGDGAAAIEMAAGGRPDLILMDISLPGIDGLEATRIIKRAQPALPVVAVTAHAMAGDRERTLAAGCDGFLSKPYLVAALLAAVADHLAAPPAGAGRPTSAALATR